MAARGGGGLLINNNMPVENGSTMLQLNAQQAIDILFQPIFRDGRLAQKFQIYRDFYGGTKKIGLMGVTEKITHKLNPCAPSYADIGSLSERTLTANYVESAFRSCYDMFMRTHYDQLAAFFENRSGDPDLRDFMRLVSGAMRQGIMLDTERVADFGDKSSTDADYNWADGVFTHLTNLVNSGELTQVINCQQGTALTPQEAFELLEDVYDNANSELTEQPLENQLIRIGGKLWKKIKRYLRENAVTNGFIDVFSKPTASGVVGTFEGIQILVENRWDKIFRDDFSIDEPNRIIYTTRDNQVMGTDLRMNAAGSEAFFRWFLNPETDVLSARANFVFDVNVVWPELYSIAYVPKA